MVNGCTKKGDSPVEGLPRPGGAQAVRPRFRHKECAPDRVSNIIVPIVNRHQASGRDFEGWCVILSPEIPAKVIGLERSPRE